MKVVVKALEQSTALLAKPVKIRRGDVHEVHVLSVWVDLDGTVGEGGVSAFDGATTAAAALEVEGFLGRQLEWPAGGGRFTRDQARAAVDMAFWDAYARQQGLPLYAAIRPRSDDTRLAAGTTVPLTGWVGHGDEDDVVAEVGRQVAAGHVAIRLKIGHRPEDDAALIHRIHEAHPTAMLRLDANGAYDTQSAIAVLTRVPPECIAFCEDPVDGTDFQSLRHVRESVPIPIVADLGVRSAEDVLRCLEAGAADAIKVKVGKLGGITGALEAIRAIEEARKQFTIGNGFSLPREALAEAHLALAYPRTVQLPGEMVGPLKLTRTAEIERLFDGSRLRMPDGPGLGFDPDDYNNLPSLKGGVE